MFTSVDKALVALITPVVSILVLSGVLPENLATPEIIGGITSALTGLLTYQWPNKTKA